MSDKIDYLVYLWFIPLILQLVLPLLMLIVWLFYKLPKSLVARRTATPATKKIERRVYPRIAGELLNAVIADSNGKIVGRVKNISTSGICITDFSKNAVKIQRELTLRTGEDNAFQLLIQPRWVQMKQTGKVFGASILNHPVGWPIIARPAG